MPRILTAVLLVLAISAQAAPQPVIHHEATITFDLNTHSVRLEDWYTVPAGVDTLYLDHGLTMASDPTAELLAMDVAGSYEGEDIKLTVSPDVRTYLATLAVAHQPTDEVRFSRENVGGEIVATVGEEGIWLSGGLSWLPGNGDALVAGKFTIITPAGWYPHLSGELVEQSTVDGRLHTVYVIEEPVDGISLVANTFSVAEREHEGVLMRTCLLEPDEKLSALYLDRTAYYLDLYNEMIGEYPYGSFTTVENWFPTGYGMPGWTLLGSQVMRLPFIPYTSFGHEIAHNWWGNSVFVDGDEGNWCEGLTVWCADYLYKQLDSPEAAHQYRRNLLKDYAAYIGSYPDRDFPLSEFKERHSGATRAVGYGKSMMVWHMLEQELGREVVLRSLRRVYREHRGQAASWSDFFVALEAESGRDLAAFKVQWLKKTGVPHITVTDVHRDGDLVRFALEQPDPPYDLQVPVAVGEVRKTLHLKHDRREYAINAPNAETLVVDPDNDLFRLLDPAEIEPTLSQVLAADNYVFVPPATGAYVRSATESFAKDFCECETPELTSDGLPGEGAVNVLVNPDPAVLEPRLPAELQVHDDLLFIAGRRHSLKENDLVFAGVGGDLIILTRSAPRLKEMGGRLRHYGKYSWLLMSGSGRDVVKGNWEAGDGALTVRLDQ